MLSVTLLALLGLASSALVPHTAKKWHDIFAWHNPDNWDHHMSKLEYLCTALDHYHGEEAEGSQHVRDVRRCCQAESVRDRMECMEGVQRGYLNFCCNDFLMRSNSRCCAKTGSERYACFHASPPTEATCSPAYAFDARFRAIPAARIDHIDPPPQDNEDIVEEFSSQEEREGEEGSFWESLSPEGLERAIGPQGAQCMANLPEDIETSHIGVDEAELEATTESTCCGPCCKAGIAIGKKRLRPGHCPYYQCRRFWVEFYRQHKSIIKHPYCCGFGFVSCCEKQYHKQMSHPSVVEVELEPIQP